MLSLGSGGSVRILGVSHSANSSTSPWVETEPGSLTGPLSISAPLVLLLCVKSGKNAENLVGSITTSLSSVFCNVKPSLFEPHTSILFLL